MNYYDKIKNLIIDNEIYTKVKDISKENHNLITHYEVGKLLNEAGKTYGENVIGNYSEKLVKDIGKKYNSRTLRRMRQLYLFFEKQKWSPAGTNLSTSHVRELFGLKDINEINYYKYISITEQLSRNELKNRIKLGEYDRLKNQTKDKLFDFEINKVTDLVKNPILIKNSCNYENISEKILQKIIVEDITSFMKELGNGFSFIDSEYKIKIGDSYNYIDLLLYNIKFKCYVVIELKTTKLSSKFTGQIQNYMNYVDKNMKEIDDNETVGIIICKNNSQYVIDYCSNEKIIAREYELI